MPRSLRSLLAVIVSLGMLSAAIAWQNTGTKTPVVDEKAPLLAKGPTYYKGNLHTHSLWSDGDDFPEMIADWYKRNGYHFVSLTDHNTVATEERWWPVPASGIGREAYDKYRVRFGASVEQRRVSDTLSVRLRRPSEYAPQLDEPGKFLLVGGEEITQYLERRGAH